MNETGMELAAGGWQLGAGDSRLSDDQNVESELHMTDTLQTISEKRSAYGLGLLDWQREMTEVRKLPKFRADQIMKGLYCEQKTSWDAFTTLPTTLRAELTEQIPIEPMQLVEESPSRDGTNKLLLACPSDGEKIETVLIPSKGRMTQCISTQAGCAFRCAFCASGQLGKRRDLTSAEIVGQVMESIRLLTAQSGTYLRALKILNDQKGLDIGARHITISSCGVVPGIQRLATEGLQFELSISLHAPTQELRRELMPVSRRWPLDELIDACAAYTKATGRLVTFEYTLIDRLNDQPQDARALIALLRRLPCKVNLIPLSPVEGFPGRRPENRACLAFLDLLMKARIPTTMRNSRGRDVDAACGQLRLRRLKEELPPQGGKE